MFSFLPLINSSVTIGLSFLLLNISAIISSKTINFLHLLFGLYFSMFLWISFISFEYSIKALKLLKCFKPVFSTSVWWLIRLNNEFVFPDLEPPIINILYGWSRISGQFRLCSFMFIFVTSKLIIFVSLYYIVTFNLFFFTH